MYFFPSKQTLSFAVRKTCIKFLEFCTDLHTNCLYLCVGKISYTSCITNGILASILYWIQYSSIFLYFFSYKIVSLQEKISRIQQIQNVPSKRLFLQHFKISKWLPFSLYVERSTTEKLVVDKKNPPLPPIQKATTSFKYWLSFRRVRWLFFFETFYSFRSIMIVLF